ncbi:hypothetical protein ACH0B5_03615 [Ureibacillus sp. 179-F W5.1 NHS]|uniref:Uncharacterized protein n=1 Tax=Lysinibacillus halotolerans TaxID=1368476 RepID=A0A3M8H7T7_9BACI|nr:hypothetical protein [Lysinibacillus halotolerans]RNC98457.1 hypothetical protein EC501_10805 [Lysinibacillus halotolerans]
MAISNPQYAFLEADYVNPNLNEAIWELQDSSEKVNNNGLLVDAQSNARFKIIPTNIYLKLNALFPYLHMVPIDMYCIVMLFIGEGFLLK